MWPGRGIRSPFALFGVAVGSVEGSERFGLVGGLARCVVQEIVGDAMSTVELQHVLDLVDSNKDGVISREEFLAAAYPSKQAIASIIIAGMNHTDWCE